MGSYANSLHVRAERSEQVVAAIHDVLREQQWQSTDESPEEDAPLGLPSPRRALWISAPAGGWVSILDSDLMGIHDLGPLLAERLGTSTIFFLVNDSDGWSYLLADANGKTSEFDTLDEDGASDESADLAGLGEKLANVEALLSDGSFQERMAQMQQQMMAAAPPEIRDCEARMRSGAATPADMQQYQAWAMGEMPKFQSQMSDLLGGLLNFAGKSAAGDGPKPKAKPKKPTRQQKAAQRKRLEKLRPLLAEGVAEEDVQAALEQRAVFAEETLAGFLPLLGIAAPYAYLDYRSLSEADPDELTAARIRFVHELRFERAAFS